MPETATSLFFSPQVIWLTPNDLVSFQLRQAFLKDAARWPGHRGFLQNLVPRLMSFSSLEGLLAGELDRPEIDPLIRDFILNAQGGALAAYLWPESSGFLDLKILARLASDLGDGLDRLKLAGLTWDQVAQLPPRKLAEILAEAGRKYEAALELRKRQDRAGLRKELLQRLTSGRKFKTLAGVREIVCRWSQRLSPFETDLILALAHSHQVELNLNCPGWVLDEKIDHGSGFALLRSIRQIEKRTDLTNLNVFFDISLHGPASATAPALSYASEMLLAPPERRWADPPDPGGNLVIVTVPTAYHEVEEAARRLKEKLRQGSSPEALALVVPDLDLYGPLIDDVGRRFGLAFHFRRGETLADQGPCRAVLDLMNLWSSNWERGRVMDLLGCPYFRFGLDQAAARRLTLRAGITDQRAGGGFEENLAKFISGDPGDGPFNTELARALSGLVARLKRGHQKLRQTRSWAEFFWEFKGILNDLGWPGPIDRAPQSPVNVLGADLSAASAFKEELDHLAEAFGDPAAPSPGLPVFRLYLEKVLKQRRLSFDRNPEGRLRVVNYHDLHGGLFDELFFLGLNERVFPRTGPEMRWWPEEFVRAAAGAELLGRPLWNEAADRYRQEELMLAAGLGQALNRVWLFHHESDETGRASLPSPLLSALEELWPDGAGGTLLPREKRDFRVTPPLSLAAGEDEMWSGLVKLPPRDWPSSLVSRANLDKREQLLRRRERWLRIKGSAEPGPAAVAAWLSRRPTYKEGPLINPAFLAAFATCPLAFWLQEALGLKDDGRELDEWGRDSQGTFLHSVLEKFISRRLGPEGEAGSPWPGEADYQECRAELLAIFNEAQWQLSRNQPLGRLPLWLIRQAELPGLLGDWLSREMSESPPDRRPFRLEWTFGDRADDQAPPWELPLNGSESLYFRGRVDRIDLGREGLLLRDYKLKESPGLRTRATEDGLPPRAWPLMIYTLAAQSHFGQRAEAWFEILDSKAGAFRLPVPPGDSPLMKQTRNGPFNFPDLLVRNWEKLKTGSFPAADEDKSCAWCPYSLLCPKGDEAQPGEGEI